MAIVVFDLGMAVIGDHEHVAIVQAVPLRQRFTQLAEFFVQDLAQVVASRAVRTGFGDVRELIRPGHIDGQYVRQRLVVVFELVGH